MNEFFGEVIALTVRVKACEGSFQVRLHFFLLGVGVCNDTFIPLVYNGRYRFIPGSARQMGYTVVETPVNHRPRIAGTTKYGIANRAIPGLIDCIAVRWMNNRRKPTAANELQVATNDTKPRKQDSIKQEAST